MARDELPPSLDEVEELDEYWTENTTITVSRYTKARLDEHRDGRPWDEFLEKLRMEHADPLTLRDIDEISDLVAEQTADLLVSELGDGMTLNYRPVLNRLDDLQAQLPKDVAEELHGVSERTAEEAFEQWWGRNHE